MSNEVILRDPKGRFLHGYPGEKKSHYVRCKNCKKKILPQTGLRCLRGNYCDGCCYILFTLKDWLKLREVKK